MTDFAVVSSDFSSPNEEIVDAPHPRSGRTAACGAHSCTCVLPIPVIAIVVRTTDLDRCGSRPEESVQPRQKSIRFSLA